MTERRPDPCRGLQPWRAAASGEPDDAGALPYASYRDAVLGLIQEPFGEVEQAIEGTDLNEDVRAALWPLAFSMREPRNRLRVARPGTLSTG